MRPTEIPRRLSLSLVVISLALTVPSFRNSLLSDELAAGSRQLIALIRSCRTKAAMEQTPYLLRMDSSGRTVWYEREQEEDTNLQGQEKQTIRLPEGIRVQRVKQATAPSTLDPMRDGLWISSQGYMDATLIQLADRSNNGISLFLSPFLQNIRVEDGFSDLD